MFYCTKCGAQLPDNANYCWQCGTPQQRPGTSAASDAAAVPEETCEIVCEKVGEKWGIYPRDIMQFRVVVYDQGGQRSIAVSPKFEVTAFQFEGPDRKNRWHRAAFEALAAQLMASGWRQVDKGEKWFNRRYRRRGGEPK